MAKIGDNIEFKTPHGQRTSGIILDISEGTALVASPILGTFSISTLDIILPIGLELYDNSMEDCDDDVWSFNPVGIHGSAGNSTDDDD